MTDDSLARSCSISSESIAAAAGGVFLPSSVRYLYLSLSLSPPQFVPPVRRLLSLFRSALLRLARHARGRGKEQRPPPQSHTKSLTPHNSPLRRRDVLLGPSRVDICMCNGEDSSNSLSLLNGEFTLASSSFSVALLPRVDIRSK